MLLFNLGSHTPNIPYVVVEVQQQYT